MGHGTRSPAGQAQFRATVEQATQSLHERKVGMGFLEFAHPSIEEGLAPLIEAGASAVTVVPLVLLAAGHAKSDISGAVEMARLEYPGLSFTYGRDLSLAPELIDAFVAHAEESVPGLCGSATDPTTGVLLVGRGSSDPDANSDLFKAARMLAEYHGFVNVEPCFISLARPSVPDALSRLEKLGATRIAVLPWFLYEGALPDRIARQAREFAETRPSLQLDLIPPLGPDPVLATLIEERAVEAEGNQVAMSCDRCIYRKRIRGFEGAYGTPIRVEFPHEHEH